MLHFSIPPRNTKEKTALREHRVNTIAEPVYGNQLQNFSVQGIPAEGEMVVTTREIPIHLADGKTITLLDPVYRIENLNYGPLHPDTMVSPRIAPPVIGMGLLEAIPAERILALADPDDRDGDGISGRANRVWSKTEQRPVLGRFGWKAGNKPTIAQQAAAAFRGDIGLSTPLAPQSHGDCTPAQAQCRHAHHGVSEAERVEVSQQLFDFLVFYNRNLAVPARRDVDDPQVLEGKRLFYESACIACHRPKFVTRRDTAGEEQSFQLIWPYTDLLLHDMGERLADGRPEGEASGREWRTPPLWGIGLTKAVSDHTRFLHDGRARNLLEAILWHGGEAEASRQESHRHEQKPKRTALLAFLNSL